VARMIGRTKSWFWWLAGFICALVFGGRAQGSEMQPEYGVRVRPPVRPPPIKREAISAKERRQVEDLVERHLAPVKAVEPTPKVAAEIRDLIGVLRKSREPAERLGAKARLDDLGPAALGALRVAATDGLGSAGSIAASIERKARRKTFRELRRLGEATLLVMREKREAAQTALARRQAEQRACELARVNNPGATDAAEVERLRVAVDAARERASALESLGARLFSERPVARPTVRPRPLPRPRPVAKYGVRPRPVPLYGVRRQ